MSVEIIAEAAQGYEGNPTVARLLARGAARAGADAVKFQLVYADEIATPDYQYYDLFRSLEMPPKAWRTVKDEASQSGLRLYLDVFGKRSLQEALEIGADGVKIHASDFFNARLMRAAYNTAPRLFIAIGGISVEELAEELARCQIRPRAGVCFMYGFQAEPTPIEANNLRRLQLLRSRFPGHRFGFMDHTDGGSDEGAVLAALAVGLGADCVEKHITLDRELRLEDYVAALPPSGFGMFVRQLRSVEKALGEASEEPSELELHYRAKMGKIVVAARDLCAGETLDPDTLVLKRLGRPRRTQWCERIEQVAGRKLLADVPRDHPIEIDMVL